MTTAEQDEPGAVQLTDAFKNEHFLPMALLVRTMSSNFASHAWSLSVAGHKKSNPPSPQSTPSPFTGVLKPDGPAGWERTFRDAIEHAVEFVLECVRV